MTQGIVSIRRNGEMVYKIIVGHDGMHAPAVVLDIKEHFRVKHELPTVEDLIYICETQDFGCSDCIVILEMNPCKWSEPHIRTKISDWDEEGKARYLDTFHVAQFNPRWKYGTAAYVEVIDL